jgi:hypothetical protein
MLDGYWEWFRKDGTTMRSGHFAMGERTGEWTTYDNAGAVDKVTRFCSDLLAWQAALPAVSWKFPQAPRICRPGASNG